MMASAAIPGVFKPVFISVTIDGKNYDEIHVDGGVTSQLFLYPLQSTSRESSMFHDSAIKRRLYIIRNTKISAEYKTITPGIVSLSQRSLETLIKSQGIGDLYRLYVGALRDGIDYRMIQVPATFEAESDEIFDPVYMSKIFDLGYAMGSNGIPWMNKPPNVEYLDHREP